MDVQNNSTGSPAPLINPWLSNTTNAPSTDQPSSGNISKLKAQRQPSDGGPAVTNITNIIYNFNLTPSQQLQQIREQQQKEEANSGDGSPGQ